MPLEHSKESLSVTQAGLTAKKAANEHAGKPQRPTTREGQGSPSQRSKQGVGACQAAEADGHIPSNADDERLETVLGTLMHNEPQRAQA